MKSKNRPNIFLIAAAVLFCFVLVSAHFSSGMYARFVTKAQGSDAARLSAFHPTAKITEEQDGSYTVQVINEKSESTAACSLTVQFRTDVPEGKTVVLKLGSKEITYKNSPVTFDGGFLAPGEAKSYSLTIELRDSYDGPSTSDSWKDYDNNTMNAASGELQFDVLATLTQAN